MCNELEPGIAKKLAQLRTPISVQKRVAITLWVLAITLWVLATTVEYRTVEYHTVAFGVARCTVCCIAQETCKSLVHILQPKYIQFPFGNNLSATDQGFLDQCGIPQCAGSIDGSHIPDPQQ